MDRAASLKRNVVSSRVPILGFFPGGSVLSHFAQGLRSAAESQPRNLGETAAKLDQMLMFTSATIVDSP